MVVAWRHAASQHIPPLLWPGTGDAVRPPAFRSLAAKAEPSDGMFDGALWPILAVLLMLALLVAVQCALGVFSPGKRRRADIRENNAWAMNLAAALGQAKLADGRAISAGMCCCISMFMGAWQLFLLFLLLHDINPEAHPVTIVPATPWIEDPWTVNCMKWVVLGILTMNIVHEAGESRAIFEALLLLEPKRLSLPPWLIGAICSVQYMVTLLTMWAGVAVILSFQAVPDILYSSFSIVALINMDEWAYYFFHEVFGFDVDFQVETDAELPKWGKLAMPFVSSAPILLGSFLLFRAWHTDVMPTARVDKWMGGLGF
mmetsp:Transcript_68311/g.193523  ORF Transcript_68311/g.193523 Transcript_68311/m.193523 type:complete len:316 (-) Transcript_68311:25-972(-)